jgi:multiple sugar transport system substrate-binding protein
MKRTAATLFAAAALTGALSVTAQSTLTVWMLPPTTARGIEVELNAFQQLNPDVNVNYEIIPWDSIVPRLEAAANGTGDAPDLFQLGSTWVRTYDELGLLYQFTDEEVAAVGGGDAFYPAAWNAALSADNGVVAFPMLIDVRAPIYRADIFAALGIDPAEAFSSMENFTAALTVIRDAGLTTRDGAPIYPLTLNGADESDVLHNLAPFIWNAGGDVYTEEGAVALSSEEALAGLAQYASLYTEGLVDPASGTQTYFDALNSFSNGRAAVTTGGSWILREMRRFGPSNTDVAPFPNGPQTFLGGSLIAVWNESDQRETAVELAQFLASAEIQTRFAESIGVLPANTRSLQSPFLLNDEDYSAFADLAADGRTYLTDSRWLFIEEALASGLSGLTAQLSAGMSDEAVNGAIAETLTEIETAVTAAAEG